MHSKTLMGLLGLGVAASLTIAVPAAATTEQAPSSLCGGEHDKKKDVKKPAPGDDKKPANPANAGGLCGGEDHQKKKDVKKPAPGDDKTPQNPA